MFDALKHQWQLLRQDQPGQRFTLLYERRRQQGGRGAGGIALMLVGAALLLIGAALLVLPGPGIPIFILGAALLASESLAMARAADALETTLRKMFKRPTSKP